ncbi:hypothetical protein PVAND_011524 [Polypedilum vanderplanki]|uniref:MULE transposase domain-containing protein n=1 Tax=Polypedilum vanderplanki TaxID=319348 RepID=A0A9J6CJQ8_POLVA|nr:hypothetical protein PVAND_011524 [Polypedilum vanderplanki]
MSLYRELNERSGGRHLVFCLEEKMLYATSKKVKNVRYLDCIEKKCPCKAKIHDNTFSRTNQVAHIHDHHEMLASFKEAYHELKLKAKEDRRPLRVIHRETLREQTLEIAGMLAWKNVRKTLQRIRAAEMPICRNLQEFVELLELEDGPIYERFGHLRGQSFYCGSIEGLPVFANKELIRALPEDFDMYVDGTFSVTPFKTRQLLVVLAELQGRPRPICYAIMTAQSQKQYAAVFTLMNMAVFSFDGVKRKPVSVTCDFEKAMRRGLVEVWPGINCYGCNFHFCQALRRKATSMTELACKVTGFSQHHQTLRMFMRLSLLPRDRVPTGLIGLLEHINQSPAISQDFCSFVEYFQRTWVRRFPIEEWCVSERIRRTNNHLEGYNNYIKQAIDHHPTPFVFLDSLLSLAHEASANYQSDLQRCAPPLIDRSRITEPLKAALKDLTENKINELEFLKKLGRRWQEPPRGVSWDDRKLISVMLIPANKTVFIIQIDCAVQNWAQLDGIGRNRCAQLGGIGQNCCAQLGGNVAQNWSQLGEIGRKWRAQLGGSVAQNWAQLGEIGRNWAKLLRTIGPNWAKLGGSVAHNWAEVSHKIGPNWAEFRRTPVDNRRSKAKHSKALMKD